MSAIVENVQVYSQAALSHREIEVLREWLRCESKVEVARRLYIAQGTVNTHLVRIRDKYAATTKTALLVRALQHGLITIEEL